MGFLKSVLKYFIKMSRPLFSFEDNKLKFKISSDLFYFHDITDFETKTRHDPYVYEAYTIKNDSLFIESIKVSNDVSWRGLPSSLFFDLFKSKLKIKKTELLEHIEYDGYEFKVYKLNDHLIINFIYIYEIRKDVFILDINANLYENLLKQFNESYVYKFDRNENEKLAIKLSLVKENAIKDFFS